MSGLSRISLTIEETTLTRFDRWIQDQGFPTRSEAVGNLIRNALVSDDWNSSDKEVAGVITIVYDHHKPAILEKLVKAQHDSGAVVICSQHAHLDHSNCLENIIVKGKVADIRLLHQHIESIKGIKHAVITMTTTGHHL